MSLLPAKGSRLTFTDVVAKRGVNPQGPDFNAYNSLQDDVVTKITRDRSDLRSTLASYKKLSEIPVELSSILKEIYVSLISDSMTGVEVERVMNSETFSNTFQLWVKEIMDDSDIKLHMLGAIDLSRRLQADKLKLEASGINLARIIMGNQRLSYSRSLGNLMKSVAGEKAISDAGKAPAKN